VAILLQAIWNYCASSLQDELPSQQFNTWIRPLKLDESAGPHQLRLLAPNRFICDWVSEKFLNRIRELVGVYQPDARLEVALGIGAKTPTAHASFNSTGSSPASPAVVQPAVVSSETEDSLQEAVAEEAGTRVIREEDIEGGLKHSNYLNVSSTFATFVEGKSNQLGLAAAKQVAENPGGA
jgi:chromosomal replication initiator protein